MTEIKSPSVARALQNAFEEVKPAEQALLDLGASSNVPTPRVTTPSAPLNEPSNTAFLQSQPKTPVNAEVVAPTPALDPQPDSLGAEVKQLLETCKADRRQTIELDDIKSKSMKWVALLDMIPDNPGSPDLLRQSFQDTVDAYETKLAKLDLKYGEGYSVDDYQLEKGLTPGGKPKNTADVRPTSFDELNTAHGTNLKAVTNALLFSNGQLVPGVKARKLGIPMTYGESAGTTILNMAHVSGVDIRGTSGFDRIEHAFRYAVDSSFSSTPTQEDVARLGEFTSFGINATSLIRRGHGGFKQGDESTLQDRLNKTPVVILGEGTKAMYVPDTTCGGETANKRINIRLLIVPDHDIAFTQEILRQTGLTDIRVASISQFSDLAPASCDRVSILWESAHQL